MIFATSCCCSNDYYLLWSLVNWATTLKGLNGGCLVIKFVASGADLFDISKLHFFYLVKVKGALWSDLSTTNAIEVINQMIKRWVMVNLFMEAIIQGF